MGGITVNTNDNINQTQYGGKTVNTNDNINQTQYTHMSSKHYTT